MTLIPPLLPLTQLSNHLPAKVCEEANQNLRTREEITV
jgi:hypothetical protein